MMMLMRKEIKKMKLKDVIVTELGTQPDPIDFEQNWIEQSLNYYRYGRSPRLMELSGDAHITKLFGDYIMPSYSECAISLYETDEKEVFKKIISWLLRTKERFEIQLNAYEEQKANLLKQVETINKAYFNDTPQTPNPDLDEHVTNYTKSVNSSDLGTPMARLDEITRLYQNVLENWCTAFYQAFIIVL